MAGGAGGVVGGSAGLEGLETGAERDFGECGANTAPCAGSKGA